MVWVDVCVCVCRVGVVLVETGCRRSRSWALVRHGCLGDDGVFSLALSSWFGKDAPAVARSSSLAPPLSVAAALNIVNGGGRGAGMCLCACSVRHDHGQGRAFG
jgi:hypothetical protein